VSWWLIITRQKKRGNPTAALRQQGVGLPLL
jgi:hypothetical protein